MVEAALQGQIRRAEMSPAAGIYRRPSLNVGHIHSVGMELQLCWVSDRKDLDAVLFFLTPEADSSNKSDFTF